MTFEQIKETVAYINGQQIKKPTVGIILGSGLSSLAEDIEIEKSINYSEIPNFPISTVKGHDGRLLFGKLGGKDVVMMSGRFHFYEGYDMQNVTFPVRVMKELGVKTLIVSNAAGGMNPDFKVGEIMFITDHINLFPEHPLRGKNDERLGVRFPDMSEPYSKKLIAIAEKVAEENGIEVKKGVYIGLQGPTFETRAEYKFLHIIGGDAVGMSTVPEVIVARHGDMDVFAASIITDLGIREEENIITHEEVLEAANEAAPKLAKIVKDLITRLNQE